MSKHDGSNEEKDITFPFIDLAEAIVGKAAVDWRRTINAGFHGVHIRTEIAHRLEVLAGLRMFFKSKWCATLCRYTPTDVRERLEEEYRHSALYRTWLEERRRGRMEE